jgi:pimeloyl-ACP methyl ester carboxylesterase
MQRSVLVLLFILAVSGVATAQPSAPPVSQPSVVLPSDLARVLKDYETAWTSRDAAALSKLLAEDGFVLPNGGAPVRGRAAIEKYYSRAGGPLALRVIAYAAEGRVGYIIGGYSGATGAPDTGKFTLTAVDPIPIKSSAAWASAFPNARLLLIKDAGHISHVEQPEIFFKAVETFLKGSFPAEAKKISAEARP